MINQRKTTSTSLLIWLIIIVAMVSYASIALAQSTQEIRVAVTETKASLYKSASASSEVITEIPKYQIVSVYDVLDNGFSLVRFEEKKGYIQSERLKVILVIEEYDPSYRGKIIADDVKLRSKASVEADIVLLLKKGSIVDVSQKHNGWYKISNGKNFGFVSSEYVDIGVEKTESFTTLTMGMSSAEVTRMQQALSDLSFYHGAINGDFGARTRDAVKQFQRSVGLVSDGIATPMTLKKLYELAFKA